MERLTKISEITGLPMPIELIESCGESACRDVCDDYVKNSCIDCPIQKCMSKLKEYQDIGLEPEEIKQAYDMYLEVYSKVSEYADLMRQGLTGVTGERVEFLDTKKTDMPDEDVFVPVDDEDIPF